MSKYVVPRIEEVTEPVFYCSTETISGYGLSSPQPRFFGFFGKDGVLARGVSFTVKLFLRERWVIGRNLLEGPYDDMLKLTKTQVEHGFENIISHEDFDRVLADWLAAADQKSPQEWWLE